MSVESIIGIVSGLISIGSFIAVLYHHYKKQPLKNLMKQLVDQSLSTKKHQSILKKMDRKLVGNHIKKEYIQGFALRNKGLEAVFKDICEQNDIEPTSEICEKFLGYDLKGFREEYHDKKKVNMSVPTDRKATNQPLSVNKDATVYMSELLMERYPDTCKNLLKILDKHNTKYLFLKGTKDIWCRDYMPIRTESGKLIQFRYDPSYLKGEEWEHLRSDVKEVCKSNNLKVQFSDINLDGGNVLICDGRAIISDRVFSENPELEKDVLIKELSQLLECEIIIIPTIHGDMTGHADGMVRFVDRNTILGNRLADEYQYWQKGIKKVLETYNLNYIDIPFFEYKGNKKHRDNAIGVYVNYLEVNDLIVTPIFGREQDKEVIEILRETFPKKQIETINYFDVALEGGLLNCTTWVM